MKLNVNTEEFFPRPVEAVWEALTDPHVLSQWLMPNDFEPEVGKKFTFVPDHRTPWDGNVECEVLELKPPRLMVWSWWTRFVQGNDGMGGSLLFRFPRAGFYAKMKIIRAEPPRLVEWQCLDSRHGPDTGFSDLKDWVGTTVRFEVVPVGKERSTLRFTHFGLNPRLECYTTCDSAWRYCLGQSLRHLLETGAGEPYTDDSEDNTPP